MKKRSGDHKIKVESAYERNKNKNRRSRWRALTIVKKTQDEMKRRMYMMWWCARQFVERVWDSSAAEEETTTNK
jgi:hypothetical protein